MSTWKWNLSSNFKYLLFPLFYGFNFTLLRKKVVILILGKADTWGLFIRCCFSFAILHPFYCFYCTDVFHLVQTKNFCFLENYFHKTLECLTHGTGSRVKLVKLLWNWKQYHKKIFSKKVSTKKNIIEYILFFFW